VAIIHAANINQGVKEYLPYSSQRFKSLLGKGCVLKTDSRVSGTLSAQSDFEVFTQFNVAELYLIMLCLKMFEDGATFLNSKHAMR